MAITEQSREVILEVVSRKSATEYEEHIRQVEARSKRVCDKGAECCMELTVEAPEDVDGGSCSRVTADCASADCRNPQLVVETALNRVPDPGGRAIIIYN